MLEQQINQDYIAAMKAKDSQKSTTLNFLRAKIKDIYIANRVEKLEDAEVVAVIKKQVKQRQDSIEQFKAGGREDLVAKESAELDMLKGYLPEEMSEEILQPIVDEAVKESGATSMKDMGNVMKALMPKVAGKADNKLVSDLVKKTLASL